MQIFKTGIQITQTVKNVQRLRTILGVFGRYGLEEFLVRMGLQKYIPAAVRAEGVEQRTLPERLRLAFEELGPTFVKLGQILGNRPDMLPDAFIEEFKKLQDNVPPVSFDQMKPLIEKELGATIDSKFSYFNQTPIAAASIGQVYEARLNTGEEVVVKVLRPEIEEVIKNDVAILSFLAAAMEKYIPEAKVISPVQMVEEFFAILNNETNFVIEANTTIKVGENFKSNDRIKIPKVYRNFSSQRVLTLERLHGIRITEVEKLRAQSIDPKELVTIGAKAFFKMVMQDGLFHGDLHGGNLFALKNNKTGEPQIGVIDFGIVGRLSASSRDTLGRMVMALVTEDYDTLCYEYAELGAVGTSVDFPAFQREVRNSLAPYMGLSLRDVKIGQVLINSTRIATKYNIRIPGDWMIVFKAMFSLEGLGRQLDPDFDFLGIGHELIKDTIKDKFSLEKITKDFSYVARDLTALIQVAPRQIRWMFRKFNSNDFAFEIQLKDVETLRRQVEKSSKGIGFAIMSAGFVMAGAISLQVSSQAMWKGYPVISGTLFLFGFLGFFGLILKKWR